MPASTAAQAQTAQATAAPAGSAANLTCPLGRPAVFHRGDLRRSVEKLASKRPLRILAIGSSTTEGIGASSVEKAYPDRLELEMPQLLPSAKLEVDGSGVGGETSSETLERLEREVPIHEPDLVVWQVGTNDALSNETEDQFRKTLADGIAAVRAAGADILLLDQQFFPSIGNMRRYERFVALIKEAGRTYNVGVVHRYALMKAWSERSKEELRALLSTDGFHMSDLGHACVARLLAEHLYTAFEETKAQRFETGAQQQQARAAR